MELIIGPRLYSTWSLRPWLVMRHFGPDIRQEVLDRLVPRYWKQAAAESGMSFLNLQLKQLAKPITAQVSEMQNGWLSPFGFHAMMNTDKLIHPAGGVEFQKLRLQVRSDGRNDYSDQTKCLAP